MVLVVYNQYKYMNTVIMEFSYIVGVREFSPGGTLNIIQVVNAQ